MSKYIVLPNLKINNANAQPVWWIISAPAITAYAGFAQALILNMDAKSHEGVAIIHHDIQFLGEQLNNKYGEESFRPHQFRSSGLIDKDDYAQGTKTLSSQPTARCHLNVSLIIAVHNDVKIKPELIKKFLRGARLAGGSITQHDEIVCDTRTHSDALKAVKKSGYSIIERQDLMELKEGERDAIDAFLRSTRRYKDKLLGADAWVVPTCLGYAGISSLKERNKTRDGLPHMYVEPLVGLVQYKSVRDEDELHFWRYSNPQPSVFLITTNKGVQKK